MNLWRSVFLRIADVAADIDVYYSVAALSGNGSCASNFEGCSC